MRLQLPPTSKACVAACIAGLVAASCSGSGSSSSSDSADFNVENISVTAGATWKINRPIDIRFNDDVDFSTVSLNTISIKDENGLTATGVFTQPSGPTGEINPRIVRFQPACPTQDDFSDAGLLPGGIEYTLLVLGSTTGGVTVQSTDGGGLEVGKSVSFITPIGDDPTNLFIDTVPGPPRFRVRGTGGVSFDNDSATYLELGGDPEAREYFGWNGIEQIGELPPSFYAMFGGVPINHYSIQANHVAVHVFVDQAVVPSANNINGQRITLEYQTATGLWKSVNTQVELVANCTEAGAEMRLSPVGLLPQGSNLRVNIKQGFEDLTEDGTLLDQVNFAIMVTASVDHPGTTDPGVDADEVLELFILAGDMDGSLEDTFAAFETPQATWGNGKLEASFAFGGTGGPNGDFDWHIPPGIDLLLNTDADTITGGPGGVPTMTQQVINGVVDIRNLFIPADSKLVIQGSNICTILASGTVTIHGRIEVRGSNSTGVGSLNTTNIPESGAVGNAGGGSGGTGSFLTNQSTPRGGSGSGAFGLSGAGGQGGESSYHPTVKNARRAAGGGGGKFGPDVFYDFTNSMGIHFLRCQTLIGMDGEAGFMGGQAGTGAESQTSRAVGGMQGNSPFIDASDENNFFGSMLKIDPITGEETLILGELDRMWAGGGGGAGGDAIQSSSFPLVPFTITGDEKGAGGGGGAGGLRILAIGQINIVNDGVTTFGSINADGGHGGGGENSLFFDRVGGGSGGGSGGHVVLSSASSISIGGNATNSDAFYTDSPTLNVHRKRSISVLGGEGGAGNDNRGGANETGAQQWRCDAIPFSHFDGVYDSTNPSSADNVPPSNGVCFIIMPNNGDLEGGPVIGAGGDGSPGIVQLHVNNPATDLLFPNLPPAAGTTYDLGLDISYAMAPPPVGWTRPTSVPDRMVPFFGRLSTSQSKWIALGLGRIQPGGVLPNDQVEFSFGGTGADGSVMQDGSSVDLEPPIIDGAALGDAGTMTTPYIEADEVTMVFAGASFTGANEIYKRNAQLARLFFIKLFEDGAEETNHQFFKVQSTDYDDVAMVLRLTVANTGGTLQAFANDVGPQNTNVSLIPQYFEVSTSNVIGSFPESTSITVSFDATVLDSLGQPSSILSYSAQNNGVFATDITQLNLAEWDFVRFKVLFDLNTTGSSVDLSTPRPSLDFIRIPWEF